MARKAKSKEGANGAGKTTLFRMITGAEKPDAGTLRLGETVKQRPCSTSRRTTSTSTRCGQPHRIKYKKLKH